MTHWKNLESQSTGELIALFQDKKVAAEKKDNAFIVLTHRFRRDVLGKCEIICGKFGHGPGVAELIARNTFVAYAKKGNFKESNGKGKTVDESFKIYLYSIAGNELVNF